MILLANIDSDGNITQSTYGNSVVDLDNVYDYRIKITEEQSENLHQYKIINKKLVKR